MSLGVSKDCFPAPTKCHNCERKRSNDVKKVSDSKEYKRCGNCHLMTYCDEVCQKEHWFKIHKKHCRFLSGKVAVKNSKHDAATCPRCIIENHASPDELTSENSPKTVCYIEDVIEGMQRALGLKFGFHEEGKKCNCSLEFACQLPFPLGEVSGQYLEIAGTGLDAMMAHILNLLTTMMYKAKTEDNKNAIIRFWIKVIHERSIMWLDILVREMPFNWVRRQLLDQVDSLRTVFGATSPWWKILKFSVHFVVKTSNDLVSIYIDPHSMKDSRFQNLKIIMDYQQSQLRNQALVSEKKIWPKLMLWPGLANGSLAILLPPGTRCQNCFDELSGEAVISPQASAGFHYFYSIEKLWKTAKPQAFAFKTRPSLLSDTGEDGALMACCPVNKNPDCRKSCFFKNVINQMQLNEDQYKAFLKENELFGIESRDCDFCLKSSLSSHRCSDCLTVQYCSLVCQKQDLDFHMSVCATSAKDKSRRLPGKEKQKDHWKSSKELWLFFQKKTDNY